jgi:radial spoke head protein 4/6
LEFPSVLASSQPTIAISEEEKENNDDDKDNSSDLRTDVKEKYPAEWNFTLKAPVSNYRPPVEIPAEAPGHGVNRYVYFVCTSSVDGLTWVELPPAATPHQINVSRRIKKLLTGDLDASVSSFPVFPGTESKEIIYMNSSLLLLLIGLFYLGNYLRALISRISASTHIAPRKFYRAGSNDENEEEEEEFDDDDASLSEFTFMRLEVLFG